jgi:hypothetical protein
MDKIRFPYGIADFYAIITQGYYYVDRTAYIPVLEDKGPTLLFLRPRRFGKSLLLSMLENYYDVKKADEFDRLFGHLAIGQHPTPLHNRYLIMRWNFSMVSAAGSGEEIRHELSDHLNGCVFEFKTRYQDILTSPIDISMENGLYSFQTALAAVQASPYKLYLLIDEYDSFANDVLMAQHSNDPTRYTDLVEGDGILKTIFRSVKAGMEGRGLERVFITGVSPVLAKDLASGFNVSEHISLDDDIADMCGFYETDVADVLTRIQAICGLTDEQTTEALTMMRTFYNGYRFTNTQQALLYNPTLALYFFKHLQSTCSYPREMQDTNLAPDRSKIGYIASIPAGNHVIGTAAHDIEPLVIPALADRFGISDMLYGAKDDRYLVSLFYYLGILTLSGTTPQGFLQLQVPNLVIRKLYIEQMADMLLPREAYNEASKVAMHFHSTGDMATVCNFLERTYMRVFDNRDYRWTNELTFKAMFLMLLFNDSLYIMDSEPAIGRSYGDLSMMIRPDMRRYELCDFLMEFKYISLHDLGMSGEEIRALDYTALAALEPVQHRLHEGQEQLARYRQTLTDTYGERLRLRCYCIVALGYERLVHCEV